MTKLTDVFFKKNTTPPIWLMRQAGRYLPEYAQIRSSVNSFFDLCYDVKKASEVTLQPIKRFGFDAAIIFSDILVLPHALGWDIEFKKQIGPVLKRFESEDDFLLLNSDFSSKINNIYETISKTRSLLDKNISLIGFAGSPWTVASYMLEGKSKHDFSTSKLFLYNNYDTAKKLINVLTEKTIEYLSKQIESGVEIVQLFDSWAGMLNNSMYDDFVIEPTKTIILKIKEKYPHVPIIGFPKGGGCNYDKYIKLTAIDGISVDQFTPVCKMKEWQKQLVVQGNLDPITLLSTKNVISTVVEQILSEMDAENFIFNLGHGILPTTPIENVEHLVSYVRSYKK